MRSALFDDELSIVEGDSAAMLQMTKHFHTQAKALGEISVVSICSLASPLSPTRYWGIRRRGCIFLSRRIFFTLSLEKHHRLGRTR